MSQVQRCWRMVDGTDADKGRDDDRGNGIYSASLSTFRLGITNLLEYEQN